MHCLEQELMLNVTLVNLKEGFLFERVPKSSLCICYTDCYSLLCPLKCKSGLR